MVLDEITGEMFAYIIWRRNIIAMLSIIKPYGDSCMPKGGSRANLRLKLGAALLCFAAFISVLSASLTARTPVGEQAGAVSTAQDVSAVTNKNSDDELRFFVSAYKGKVCVYNFENRNVPAIVTKIMVSGLRESDRELVEAGIEVIGTDELLMLLEDFGS